MESLFRLYPQIQLHFTVDPKHFLVIPLVSPFSQIGCHIKLADGAFAMLMNELGIKPSDLSKKPEELDKDWFKWYLDSQGKRRKGKSTLKKWTCPVCGLNARMGIKDNPMIRHDPCEQKTGHSVFIIQVDDLTHTIYKDKNSIKLFYKKSVVILKKRDVLGSEKEEL